MSDLTQTFAALGNDTRLVLVEQLLAKGELAAGDLLAEAGISGPALSRHLKVLREAGIVTRRIEAQRRLYSVRPAALQAVGDWALTYRAFWGGSLDRLEAALNKERH
ncbi:MAG: winged helix-turn-helix transcriptional regulator [Rhodobacteraceae bacterium]|nr:winged helix-turn-helix transcriptional regulator [Paracoccaceae bacterium]